MPRSLADGLDVHELSIVANAAHQRLPSIHYNRFEYRSFEKSFIDSPAERVDVEARPTGLLHRITRGIEQARAPESVGLLERYDSLGHFAELLHESRPRWMILRKVL